MNNDELSEYCVVSGWAKAFQATFYEVYNDFPALFQAFLFLVVSPSACSVQVFAADV